MMFYTVLIYLIVAIVGNGAFYFGCQEECEYCTVVSAIFFNIAVLCQMLPLFTNKVEHEKNQKNGQKLLCSIYLLCVIILSAWCMCCDVSYVTAGTIQTIILGIFLTSYLSIARANVKTINVVTGNKARRSSSLQEAKANIRYAISICQSSVEKTILREACAELDSMAVEYNVALEGLDTDILSKVKTLCNNPDIAISRELSQLIQKRKSMAMLSLR